MKSCDSWPQFVYSSSTQVENNDNMLLCLLSIDSGRGSVKLMGKFIHTNTSHRASDVLLLAVGVGSDESFSGLNRYFGKSAKEIEEIATEGLIVDSNIQKIHFLFVGDFKVVYSLLGANGSSSRRPCPWCVYFQSNRLSCIINILLTLEIAILIISLMGREFVLT